MELGQTNRKNKYIYSPQRWCKEEKKNVRMQQLASNVRKIPFSLFKKRRDMQKDGFLFTNAAMTMTFFLVQCL